MSSVTPLANVHILGQFGDYEGLSKATFEIITMTGWVESNAK